MQKDSAQDWFCILNGFFYGKNRSLSKNVLRKILYGCLGCNEHLRAARLAFSSGTASVCDSEELFGLFVIWLSEKWNEEIHVLGAQKATQDFSLKCGSAWQPMACYWDLFYKEVTTFAEQVLFPGKLKPLKLSLSLPSFENRGLCSSFSCLQSTILNEHFCHRRPCKIHCWYLRLSSSETVCKGVRWKITQIISVFFSFLVEYT